MPPMPVEVATVNPQKMVDQFETVAESVVDHLHIIEAMEKRDAELAEKLVHEHTEHLAHHVKEFVNWEH